MSDFEIGALARKQLSFPVESYDHTCHSGQTATITLEVSAIMAKADSNSRVVFWVGLDGSHTSPGPMKFKRKDKKGQFQDIIEVEMIPLRSNPKSAWIPASDLVVITDSPTTYNGTGSFSNTVSFSFSSSFSGGFFGKDATSNASLSVSASESHTFGHSIADFELANHTKAMHVHLNT